jgi:hypothetical protein
MPPQPGRTGTGASPSLTLRVELLQGGAIGSDDEPKPRRGNDAGEDRQAVLPSFNTLTALSP